jgi:hypothetical protein
VVEQPSVVERSRDHDQPSVVGESSVVERSRDHTPELVEEVAQRPSRNQGEPKLKDTVFGPVPVDGDDKVVERSRDHDDQADDVETKDTHGTEQREVPATRVVDKSSVVERSRDREAHTSAELLEKITGTAVDSPLCMTCGTKMRPAGSCYVCEGCGSTSGCS